MTQGDSGHCLCAISQRRPRFVVFMIMSVYLLLIMSGCLRNGQAQIPKSSDYWVGKNYETVIKKFEDKGFTNIRTETISDLIVKKNDGSVESVTVGGSSDYEKGQWVPNDTEVVITYHILRDESELGFFEKIERKLDGWFGGLLGGLMTILKVVFFIIVFFVVLGVLVFIFGEIHEDSSNNKRKVQSGSKTYVLSEKKASSPTKPIVRTSNSQANTVQPTPKVVQDHEKKVINREKIYTLPECIDQTEDTMSYKLDEDVIRVCNSIEKTENSTVLNDLKSEEEENITIIFPWMYHFKETLEVANTLQKNLESNESTTLKRSKFHYYTSLHFRSMIAADLIYAEYRKAADSLDEIGEIIVKIGKKEIQVTNAQYKEIFMVKDVVKNARDMLHKSVQELNHKTHTFKLKIRDECGDRGQMWYTEMERRKKN